ncbi:hypothetical protein LRP52_37415 [Photobacterium sp. ZSDE20]|uniref:Uncharacterized protein n=2 Tax=Photobacterium pectinilyticum TaxID=2906793 RepID=A0ABT1N0U0_9GAMM|nr:hypothetical protein [Photobacterium sp. ZSDE20]MDD1827868.1 hypothetical protein [Photobacterium sp. ZSDE20]
MLPRVKKGDLDYIVVKRLRLAINDYHGKHRTMITPSALLVYLTVTVAELPLIHRFSG